MDIAFFNKWLHLLSIIGTLGGIFFALIVLAPEKTEPGDDGRTRALWKRFGIAFGALWLIVLATGFYNLVLVSPKVNSEYQKILGMKMGLALLMFFLSLLIAHPIPALARFFQNNRTRKTWLGLLLVMGIVIVGISAHLNISRVNGTGLKSNDKTAGTTPP